MLCVGGGEKSRPRNLNRYCGDQDLLDSRFNFNNGKSGVCVWVEMQFSNEGGMKEGFFFFFSRKSILDCVLSHHEKIFWIAVWFFMWDQHSGRIASSTKENIMSTEVFWLLDIQLIPYGPTF